jgi:hypothetical protein
VGLPRFKDDGTQWKELTGNFARPFSKNAECLTGLQFHLLQSFEKEFRKTAEYDKLFVEYVDFPVEYSAPLVPVSDHQRNLIRCLTVKVKPAIYQERRKT